MKRGRHSGAGAGMGSSGGEGIDELYRRLIGHDDGSLPLPPIGGDPHLLTSRVRKHYLNSVIKLLCVNYEQSQKLLGKNTRLPSAIWRCAKYIELQAAQACMLMQLYRENILVAIKQLKTDTEKGKLYRKLFDCLLHPSANDKAIQANFNNKNPLHSQIKKRKCSFPNDEKDKSINEKSPLNNNEVPAFDDQQYHIPVVVNVQSAECPTFVDVQTTPKEAPPFITVPLVDTSQSLQSPAQPVQASANTSQPLPSSVQQSQMYNATQNGTSTSHTITANTMGAHAAGSHFEPNNRLSIESLDAEDQVMLQMEQLFKTDDTDDDLFEGALCNDFDIFTFQNEGHASDISKNGVATNPVPVTPVEAPIENPANGTSLDERIALLKSTGALAPPSVHKDGPKPKKPSVSKWICELYFQRRKLSETLDTILETNRNKYNKIKRRFLDLFGEDDDDELIMSPLEETQEFLWSCNERIAPIVVNNLMPYYNKGRIKTKALFKSVAKDIIDKIIAINRFPDDYEVFTFITDYFKARPVIRCQSDYKF